MPATATRIFPELSTAFACAAPPGSDARAAPSRPPRNEHCRAPGTTHMGILRPANARSLGAHMGPARTQLEKTLPGKLAEPAQGAVGPLPGRNTPPLFRLTTRQPGAC